MLTNLLGDDNGDDNVKLNFEKKIRFSVFLNNCHFFLICF